MSLFFRKTEQNLAEEGKKKKGPKNAKKTEADGKFWLPKSISSHKISDITVSFLTWMWHISDMSVTHFWHVCDTFDISVTCLTGSDDEYVVPKDEDEIMPDTGKIARDENVSDMDYLRSLQKVNILRILSEFSGKILGSLGELMTS